MRWFFAFGLLVASAGLLASVALPTGLAEVPVAPGLGILLNGRLIASIVGPALGVALVSVGMIRCGWLRRGR